ncbi:MAG: GAF domain-containing protein [Burkholderiales bacterium]|nr:GAF domain-containing protein [Burkholderiales bacterium]
MRLLEAHTDKPAGAAALPVAGIFAEITAGLANGNDLETLLSSFLAPLLRLAGAQAGAVRTLTEDGQRMQLVGAIGLPPEVVAAEQLVDRHCGYCGIAADTDTLTWGTDLRGCARRCAAMYFGQSCQRVLAVPLRHRDTVLGIYTLFFGAGGELGPDVEAVLRSIGELLGLALHNARLERENLRATVMNERQLLAGEVHDAVAQTLAYMKMRLPLLQDAMLQHDDERSMKYFGDVKRAVGEAHASLREILTHFRTRIDPQGLLHALRGIAGGFLDRTGIALEFDCRATDLRLSVEQEVQVFLIVQEALANIAKHSLARQARLAIVQTPQQIEIVVEDDGSGMAAMALVSHQSASGSQSHFGTEIMQERAQRLGGSVQLSEREGGGTRVRLTLPVQRSEGMP